MTREQQLVQCAEQLLASIKDGSIKGPLRHYYREIFGLALKGQLFEEDDKSPVKKN